MIHECCLGFLGSYAYFFKKELERMFAFSRVFNSSRLFEKMRQRARFKITMRTSSIYSRKYLAKDDNRKSFFFRINWHSKNKLFPNSMLYFAWNTIKCSGHSKVCLNLSSNYVFDVSHPFWNLNNWLELPLHFIRSPCK